MRRRYLLTRTIYIVPPAGRGHIVPKVPLSAAESPGASVGWTDRAGRSEPRTRPCNPRCRMAESELDGRRTASREPAHHDTFKAKVVEKRCVHVGLHGDEYTLGGISDPR